MNFVNACDACSNDHARVKCIDIKVLGRVRVPTYGYKAFGTRSCANLWIKRFWDAFVCQLMDKKVLGRVRVPTYGYKGFGTRSCANLWI